MPKQTKSKELDPELAGLPARARMAREELGIGVRELGDLSGIKGAGVSRIENGKRLHGLSVSTVLALSRALGVNVQWLLTGTGVKDANGMFAVFELTSQHIEAIRKRTSEVKPAAAASGK